MDRRDEGSSGRLGHCALLRELDKEKPKCEYLSLTFVPQNETLLEQTANK